MVFIFPFKHYAVLNFRRPRNSWARVRTGFRHDDVDDNHIIIIIIIIIVQLIIIYDDSSRSRPSLGVVSVL